MQALLAAMPALNRGRRARPGSQETDLTGNAHPSRQEERAASRLCACRALTLRARVEGACVFSMSSRRVIGRALVCDEVFHLGGAFVAVALATRRAPLEEFDAMRLAHRSHILSAQLMGALLLTLALSACGPSAATTSAPEQPLLTKDSNGTTIVIPKTAPQRIVSLTPVDSEILGALHAQPRVVGVDYYTDYPTDMAAKTKVTDASSVANIEQIIALKPDLVLSYGHETNSSVSHADTQLMAAHITVYDLPAMDLQGSISEIRLIGQLIHSEQEANALADSMQSSINAVKSKVAGESKPTVYMELYYGNGPTYVFGGGSFGDELISDAGGVNIFHSDSSGEGYPAVNNEAIIAANPQVIILTDGATAEQVAQRPGWSAISAVKNGMIFTIDPNLTQRPGPRIIQGLQEIAKDLHPALFQ
jgi:iron complex transport system substrate-binding protein